jgi:hypothetical protein
MWPDGLWFNTNRFAPRFGDVAAALICRGAKNDALGLKLVFSKILSDRAKYQMVMQRIGWL